MTLQPQRDPGSFRDPSGQVFLVGDRVYRAIYGDALSEWEATSAFVGRMAEQGRIVATSVAPNDVLAAEANQPRAVLEHERLPFISYPYEWSFAALKAAALHHLDLQLEALAENIVLSDASAYNVQFVGARPVFIDVLSFRRYRDGEFWVAHRQFCEQFLNPLLLRSLLGISHNSWFRGSLEGITSVDLARLLKWRHKLSWNVLTQVTLQASFQRSAMSQKGAVDGDKIRRIGFPKTAYGSMLTRLRSWIQTLQPADGNSTVWRDYATTTSYNSDESESKRAFIAEYAAAVKPSMLWDLGCNTGDYSAVALEAGAEYVVGFDFDQGALDAAFSRATSTGMRFQTLFLDAANPSPSQGWAHGERRSLGSRANASGLIGLALIHHLAISRNIPLDQVIGWLVGLAPTGVIEFVPKTDPMVIELLKLREDIFPDYGTEAFEAALGKHAAILRRQTISASGRTLYQFDRTAR